MYLYNFKFQRPWYNTAGEPVTTVEDDWSCVSTNAALAIEMFVSYTVERGWSWWDILELRRVVQVHRTQKVRVE
jgi:hypothetical protein